MIYCMCGCVFCILCPWLRSVTVTHNPLLKFTGAFRAAAVYPAALCQTHLTGSPSLLTQITHYSSTSIHTHTHSYTPIHTHTQLILPITFRNVDINMDGYHCEYYNYYYYYNGYCYQYCSMLVRSVLQYACEIRLQWVVMRYCMWPLSCGKQPQIFPIYTSTNIQSCLYVYNTLLWAIHKYIRIS